jgi:hypothetical protein
MSGSDIAMLFVIAPITIFIFTIAYLTKNDKDAIEALRKHKEAVNQSQSVRIYKVEEVVSWLVLPITVLFLWTNLFGASLLILSGITFFFHERIWTASYLQSGMVAKVIGIFHLALGVTSFMLFLCRGR